MTSAVAPDRAYTRLKDQLIRLTGLAFYSHRDEVLGDVIQRRMSDLGFPGYSAYTRFLADGQAGDAEMEVLIAQLTIGETYFFRDTAQFAAMRDVVLPDILARNRSSKQLRIWSAGCATGAEPYSLAILLTQILGDTIADWHVEICASDLNRSYLIRAAEGKFRNWAFRSTSDELRRECFSKEGLLWTLNPQYKQWITFHHLNLVDSEYSTPLGADAQFDLILCRNVMIYFGPDVIRRLIGQFHRSLGDGGWLVVGAAENNLENYTAFRTVNDPGATLYQKLPRPPLPRVAVKEVVAESGPLLQPPADCRPAPMEILRQLADRGDWRDAAEYARRMLLDDRLNPAIHYYLALILESLGIEDESERSLRQAIYLDRNFALAHYHLGLALKRHSEMPAAARSFGNVLKVLAGMPENAVVTAGPGVTVTGLKALAKMHLGDSNRS